MISKGTEEIEGSSTSDTEIDLCSNNEKLVVSTVSLFYSIILWSVIILDEQQPGKVTKYLENLNMHLKMMWNQ